MMESNCIVLLVLVILASVNGKFGVVGPSDPIKAIAGEDAVLECQLVPDEFLSSMVVQWFKSGLDSPVHVYINGEDHIAAQHKDYRRRTELFKDELTKGNISLRLQNIMQSDQGEYICSVDDGTDSEMFTVRLEVVGFGCEPWIQMKGYDINGIQLVCKSTGWFPEPKIEWISEDGHNLIQAETTSHWGSTGLVDVHSNIVIPRQSSNRLTCRVQNKLLKTEQEVTIGISGDFLPVVPAWLVPLLVAVLVLIVAISAMIYWTVKHYPHMKELELWKFIIEHEWKRICECEAPVTLDPNTTHANLLLSEDLSTVWNTGNRQQLLDNPERFDPCISVLGSEGFTSGKHSWEVEVGNKTEWTVGVVKESINRKEAFYTSPNNGYWKVSLREGNKYWAREEIWKRLELSMKPRKVRVCLDYEGGKVSFYNSENKSHIYTFTATFTEKIYPYFSPCNTDGGKNTEPLKICPRRVTIQEDERFIPSSK